MPHPCLLHCVQEEVTDHCCSVREEERAREGGEERRGTEGGKVNQPDWQAGRDGGGEGGDKEIGREGRQRRRCREG